jgi:hypothetical protein
MPKKVVVKMRNLKKILGNEMLQLAIVLSLMRVDPDALLFPGGGSTNNSSFDSYDFNGGVQDDVWTQSTYGDGGFGRFGGLGGGDFSPRLHPKSMDAVIERFHEEILEDLNSLGRYQSIRAFRGEPVEISAYIVNTGSSRPTSSSSSSAIPNNYADSDSGISDTDVIASGSDAGDEEDSDNDRHKEDEEEEEEEEEDDHEIVSPEPMLGDILESELELDVGDPMDVFGAPSASSSSDLDLNLVPDVLEDQLFHIDDQGRDSPMFKNYSILRFLMRFLTG